MLSGDSTDTEIVEDWRLNALKYLEQDVQLFAWKYKIKWLDREDVAQELRVALWNNLHKYNPELASLRTWAWRVIRNKTYDLHKYSTCKKRNFIIVSFVEIDIMR